MPRITRHDGRRRPQVGAARTVGYNESLVPSSGVVKPRNVWAESILNVAVRRVRCHDERPVSTPRDLGRDPLKLERDVDPDDRFAGPAAERSSHESIRLKRPLAEASSTTRRWLAGLSAAAAAGPDHRRRLHPQMPGHRGRLIASRLPVKRCSNASQTRATCRNRFPSTTARIRRQSARPMGTMLA